MTGSGAGGRAALEQDGMLRADGAEADGKTGKPPLEAIKLSKHGRSHITEDVMGILAIRDVKRIHPQADFPDFALGALSKWNADRKVPVHFYVERKISRETDAIGNTDIILKNIHI